MKVLVINAGSSSLKYQLIDMETEAVLAKGLCERIGIDGHLKHTPLVGGKPVFNEDIALPTHSEAIAAVIDKLTSAEYGVVKSMSEIDAVGHRVVHGGEKFACSVRITDEVMKALEDCTPFAPLHNPANITGINACTAVMGKDVPQVAVFDTAFHQTMPAKAFTYAVPYEYYKNDGIRRYGFHGTSHRYVSARCAELMGKPIEELKLISCHMGNGSSICAIDGGKSVRHLHGLHSPGRPADGYPLRRPRPGRHAVHHEQVRHEHRRDAQRAQQEVRRAGRLRRLQRLPVTSRPAADEGNERARLALDMFDYWVAKVVGSYAAAMNGVDAIIFTRRRRARTAPPPARASASTLGYLGCEIDPEPNKKRGEDICISTADSKVKLFVIPTNEELVIAPRHPRQSSTAEPDSTQ